MQCVWPSEAAGQSATHSVVEGVWSNFSCMLHDSNGGGAMMEDPHQGTPSIHDSTAEALVAQQLQMRRAPKPSVTVVQHAGVSTEEGQKMLFLGQVRKYHGDQRPQGLH